MLRLPSRCWECIDPRRARGKRRPAVCGGLPDSLCCWHIGGVFQDVSGNRDQYSTTHSMIQQQCVASARLSTPFLVQTLDPQEGARQLLSSSLASFAGAAGQAPGTAMAAEAHHYRVQQSGGLFQIRTPCIGDDLQQSHVTELRTWHQPSYVTAAAVGEVERASDLELASSQ